MTASAGAPSTRNIQWKTINWSTVEYQVKRLQLRIAKANNKIKSKDSPKSVILIKAAHTVISRHIKIRGKATPYDSDFDLYFTKRDNWIKARRRHSRAP